MTSPTRDGPAVAVPRARSETLDLLRAVAALGVVALHFAPYSNAVGPRIPGADMGEAGVQLFFVLSGYLITNAVLSRSFTPRSYSVNRAFRILPAYGFALVVSLMFQTGHPFSTGAGIKDLGLHLVMLHSLSRTSRLTLNPVLWTLSIEWIFYVFMLVFAPAIRHRIGGWITVALMFVVSLGYREWLWHAFRTATDRNFAFKQFPGMLDEFACGMLAAMAVRQAWVHRALARRWVSSLGLAVSAVVLAVCLWVFHHHNAGVPKVGFWHEWYMVMVWPVAFCGACALLLVCLLQFETQLAPWIRRSGLGFVGVCSYSLYLFHAVVIDSFRRGWDPTRPHLPALLYLTFTAVAILVTAALSYTLVEKPFMAMRTRFSGRGQPLSPVTGDDRSTPEPVPATV